MTLLIAYLLMYQIGDFHWLSYVGVFLLWFWHLNYHVAVTVRSVKQVLKR